MTDKEMGTILNDMVIIVDTREKENGHILDYLKENKIPYITQKLCSGDYSFILPNHQHLGLDLKYVVERKGSLDELAGNLTKGRERFIREFERLTPDQRMDIVVEKASWKKLLNGSYRSSFSPNSYKASLHCINIDYDIPIWFCNTVESPILIYDRLKYRLFRYLKKDLTNC